MATPADLTPDARPREERFIHFIARESTLVLRVLVIGALAATILSMVSLWYLAIIPALFLLVTYAALMIAREVERRTDVPGTDAPPQPVEALEETIHDEPGEPFAPEDIALVKRESKTALWILLGVGVGAVCLAAVAIFAIDLIEPRFLALAAFVLFAYILIVMAPVWLGWIEDDIEEHQSSD